MQVMIDTVNCNGAGETQTICTIMLIAWHRTEYMYHFDTKLWYCYYCVMQVMIDTVTMQEKAKTICTIMLIAWHRRDYMYHFDTKLWYCYYCVMQVKIDTVTMHGKTKTGRSQTQL